MRVREESEKAGLKLNIQKTKIMVFGPITSWQIDVEKVETVTDFILGAPKSLQMVIVAMKLKKHLLLGRKAMTNLDSVLKSRDITLPTKVHIVKAMVFPMVMYGYESWKMKKAEQELMLLNCVAEEDSLKIPWAARRSNQSILKEINPKYSFEGLMLKLELQYFDQLMRRADS